ncbi:MAG: hypothetical protein IJD67_01360 [Clostridia bacterium]|nr:hypothetical protein [Clostridia bacterium]
MEVHIKVADIGGMDSEKTGYDSNAWFFQDAQAMKLLIKFKLSFVEGMKDSIKEIEEYLW